MIATVMMAWEGYIIGDLSYSLFFTYHRDEFLWGFLSQWFPFLSFPFISLSSHFVSVDIGTFLPLPPLLL